MSGSISSSTSASISTSRCCATSAMSIFVKLLEDLGQLGRLQAVDD